MTDIDVPKRLSGADKSTYKSRVATMKGLNDVELHLAIVEFEAAYGRTATVDGQDYWTALYNVYEEELIRRGHYD